jgi:hypothetical protein
MPLYLELCIKINLKKLGARMWTGLIWLRRGTMVKFLNYIKNYRLPKKVDDMSCGNIQAKNNTDHGSRQEQNNKRNFIHGCEIEMTKWEIKGRDTRLQTGEAEKTGSSTVKHTNLMMRTSAIMLLT